MALRERTGTLDLESRPPTSSTRDKKLNFLQRWVVNHHQHRRSTPTNSGGGGDGGIGGGGGDTPALACNTSNHYLASMLSSSSTSTYTTTAPTAGPQQQYNISATAVATGSTHNKRYMPYLSPTTFNIIEWMQAECPVGILPLILAFAGPQTSMALSRTNQFWNHVLQDDATWRVLCEELYKVCPTTKERIYHFSPFCRSPTRNSIFRSTCIVVLSKFCSGKKGMMFPTCLGEIFTNTILVSQPILRPFMQRWPW
jgi:hypothetical protein